MLQNAHNDPQSLFNTLLSPEILNKIPSQLQQIMIPPLKSALADSLHTVFFVCTIIVLLGIPASFLLGESKIKNKTKMHGKK